MPSLAYVYTSLIALISSLQLEQYLALCQPEVSIDITLNEIYLIHDLLVTYKHVLVSNRFWLQECIDFVVNSLCLRLSLLSNYLLIFWDGVCVCVCVRARMRVRVFVCVAIDLTVEHLLRSRNMWH